MSHASPQTPGSTRGLSASGGPPDTSNQATGRRSNEIADSAIYSENLVTLDADAQLRRCGREVRLLLDDTGASIALSSSARDPLEVGVIGVPSPNAVHCLSPSLPIAGVCGEPSRVKVQ